MKVEPVFGYNALRNFSYLVINSQGECLCFDPYDGKQMIKHIVENSYTLKAVLNTHDHFDHTRGNRELIDYFNIPLIKNQHGLEIDLLGEEISIHCSHTPGHTMEHFSYLLKHGEKNIAVFAGDTLFNAGVGNCKNGGNIPILEKSIDQYYRNHYPDEVIIYPGHDYFYNNLEFLDSVMRTSVLREDYKKRITELKNKDEFLFITLKEEKEINPFLTTKLVEDVDNFKGLSQKEVFYYLRKLRDQW